MVFHVKVETVGIVDFSSFQCLQIRESFFTAMHAPKSCMNLMLYVVKKGEKEVEMELNFLVLQGYSNDPPHHRSFFFDKLRSYRRSRKNRHRLFINYL